jgi:hypothetical protein
MRNQKLATLSRRIVHQFGHVYSTQYLYPLTNFVSATSDATVQTIASRGLSQESIQSSLREILDGDAHLLKCCGDVWHLAQAIDVLFLRKLSVLHFAAEDTLSDTQPGYLDGALHEFEQQLYEQGEFQKFACFHLFNVKFLSTHVIKPPYDGWVINELEHSAVPRLMGEPSIRSFVSPPSTGTWFLICKDSNGFETELLYDWLARRWKEAQPFRKVIQYTVDGVCDIDYVVPHFSPEWVNEIQKGGLYFLGSPRQDSVPVSLCPHLTGHEQQQINRMWQAYGHHRARIIATGPTLRKAIRIAGEFFEDYHRKTSRAEQLANLIISLEALFTPTAQGELTFRISQSCALLSHEPGDSQGRQETYRFLLEMFARRGKLFHGQFDSETESPDKLASDQEISKLASLVRKSILRVMAIYLRGESDLKNLREQFQKAALDEVLRDELLTKGNIDALINDTIGDI